jgi:hypothetical protein
MTETGPEAGRTETGPEAGRTETGPEAGRTETGPLGEEAARLLGAAQDWLHRVVLDPATARVATGSPECCWCPLCQLIAAMRGNRPELTERLSEALTALTELQTALARLLRPAAEQPMPDQRPARTVHRIDLSDQDEPVEQDEPASDEPGG